MDHIGRDRLWRSWVVTVTGAEVAGFVVPAAVGALTAQAVWTVALPALLAAGAVEGALLGWGQASVLGRELPGFPRRRWVTRTSAGAVVAYAVGLLPSSLAGIWQSWPVTVQAAIGGLLALVLLNTIGVAQWTVLRHLFPHAGEWVWWSAIGWLAGLGVFLAFTMPLWHPGQRLAVTIAVGVAGAVLMAAVMAMITGVAVRRLMRPAVRVTVAAPEPPRTPRADSPEESTGRVQRNRRR